MTDYSQLTKEELEAKSIEITKQRKALKREGVIIQAELSRLYALKRLGNMSDKEKKTLLQVLSPKGIDSSESVGTPKSG